MKRLDETFEVLRQRGERALVTFVTGGDPSIKALPAILDALADGGADVIEVGLPFSDPIADGPTIQASSQRALDRGVTPRQVLSAISGFDRVPVVLMGYMNPMLKFGLVSFASEAVKAGAGGTIVCDLTPDEAGNWIADSKARGLDCIFLAAPNSPDPRLREVCQKATGFVYAVSRTGVTGSSDQPWEEARALVAKLRPMTSLPVCVGFGVSTAEDVRELCAFADGVIVGSRIVDLLSNEWDDGKGRGRLVEFVKSLKAATRDGHEA